MNCRARSVAAWAALTLALAVPHVVAKPPSPARGHAACKPAQNAARQERLSKLLRDLAASHRMHVENWSRDDPVVVLAGGSDVELMQALSRQVNLMARYAVSKDCPGQWRIETIWILPGLPASSSPQPAAASAVTPTASQKSPEQAAITKRATNMYLRAHGPRSAVPASGAAAEASGMAP